MPKKYYSGNSNFYPLLIVSNIGCILSISYICSIILTLVIDFLFNVNFHQSQIFGNEQWDFTSKYSLVALLVSIFYSAIMIFTYVIFVEKANKIIDYALTNYLFTLLINWMLSSFPFLLSYWVASGVQVTLIILISEYIALRIERQDIKLNLNFLGGNI